MRRFSIIHLNIVVQHNLYKTRILMANKNQNTQEEKLNNARRKLNFGEPDKDEPSKEEFSRRIKEELIKDMENKKSKWNFDFEKECPLQGQWEWERIQPQHSSTSAQSAELPKNTTGNGGAADQAH